MSYDPFVDPLERVGISAISKDTNLLDNDDEIDILDEQWLSSRFMVPAKDLDVNFRVQSYKSTAHYKFQDTTIGGHRAVNPPPQFTRYADIRANDFWSPWDPMTNVQTVGQDKMYVLTPDGKASNVISNINFYTTTSHTGMGRFYAEALDDGWQEVYLTFGIPKFNGLLDFFKAAVSYEDAYIMKNGRVPTTYNSVDGAIGLLTLYFFPGTTILTFLAKRGFELVMGNKPYNYYYMEPAMHLFWPTATNIANQIATAMGILAVSKNDKGQKDTDDSRNLVQGKAMRFDPIMMKILNDSFQDMDIFSPVNNYIDLYALATRYQSRVNTILRADIEYLSNGKNPFGTTLDMQKYQLKSVMSANNTLMSRTFLGDVNKNIPKVDVTKQNVTLKDDANNLKKQAPHLFEKEDPNKPKGTVPDTVNKESSFFSIDGLGRSISYISNLVKEKWKKSEKIFDANSRLATSQVIFLVQPTGATSESFSNSTGEIQTGGTIKQIGQAAHHVNFNLQGGKLGIGPIDALIDSAKQIGNSFLDNFTMGASNLVRGLMLGAYVDVPKMWEDSDCSFPSVTYSMDLIAPYGHPYSRFQNIVVPLSILLAGTLPLRVGKSSYASPFLCSCYCQGVQHIRLGMITDLSITRGGGSLQQTIDRKTNFVSVSFSITDFGHKIAAPINNTMFRGDFFPVIEEETPFADYVDMLTGRHISSMTWVWPNINQRFSNLLKMRSSINPTNIASRAGTFVGDTFPMSIFFHYPAALGNTMSI